MILLYDLCIFLMGLLYLPHALYQMVFKKKYRSSFTQRLGAHLPKRTDTKKQVIWIHMVSMGETRAMIPLYKKLREHYPDAALYLSSTTETGHQEAKRSLPSAEGYFYLPLDLSFLMQRLVKELKPNLLLLSESDFWFNMMHAVKKQGGKVVLVNGKLSERSANRFSRLSLFAKPLFSQIDLFCLQSTEFEKRFSSLIPQEKIRVTGNLKLSIPPKQLSKEEKAHFRKEFGIQEGERVITIGSTHAGEEELILSLIPSFYRILLVPRHPERFANVKKWLEKQNLPHVTLVDRMGILSQCYQISELAIVGGSFIPGVGGHNIFEPIQAGIPVLFGPHMETQKELVEMILDAQAGIQIDIKNLSTALSEAPFLKENAHKLSHKGEEVIDKTWKELTAIAFK